jgi:hypothetical protein
MKDEEYAIDRRSEKRKKETLNFKKGWERTNDESLSIILFSYYCHPLSVLPGKCKVPTIKHGNVIGLEAGMSVNHGTPLSVNCSEGFTLNDTAQPECFNGTWTFIPECIPGESGGIEGT